MSTEVNTRELLLQKITAKRSEIRSFLSKAEPRRKRLANVAIVCSAVAAAFTVGPGVGGKSLTAWMTNTLELTSPVWQLLCLGATGCSVAAVIATNLSKSNDMDLK